MKIGIDFDNTIVCYDKVFHQAAKQRGWLLSDVPDSKDALRNYFRSIGKEALWTELQGYVYGTQMHLAKPFEGVREFFQQCKEPLFIISHKTKAPYLGPLYDLHLSAREWWQAQDFPQNIPLFFELTLQEKLQRIATLGCDVFIDDLPEVLLEKNFPPQVEKILFDPQHQYQADPRYLKFSFWNEIHDCLIDQKTDSLLTPLLPKKAMNLSSSRHAR